MSLDSLDPTFTQDVPCVKEFFCTRYDYFACFMFISFIFFDFFFQFLHEATTKISNQRRNRGPTLTLHVQL